MLLMMADFNRGFSRIKLEIAFLCEKNTKNNCCIQTFFPWEGFFTLVGRGRKEEIEEFMRRRKFKIFRADKLMYGKRKSYPPNSLLKTYTLIRPHKIELTNFDFMFSIFSVICNLLFLFVAIPNLGMSLNYERLFTIS